MTESILPSLGLVGRPGPAQDLWATAATRESYHPNALLETWLKNNGTAQKEDKRLAMRTALDLQTVGVSVADASGTSALQLPISQRLNVLKIIGARKALGVLTVMDASDCTLTERTFKALLAQEFVAVNRDDRTRLMALDTVAPWVVAAGVKLPFKPQELERQLGRIDFLNTIGGTDLYRFIGRKDITRRLNALWQGKGARQQSVLIEGPGGIGKSMVISRFIASLLESDEPKNRPDAVFHIDFDRLSLQHARPSTILQEMVRQASQWWNLERSEDLVNLTRDLSHGSAGLEFFGAHSRSIEATRGDRFLAQQLIKMLRRNRPDLAVVIFVDSFEQIETFDDGAADSPSIVHDIFASAGVRVLSIYASRAFARPQRIAERRPIRLQQFSVHEADEYLQNEAARAGFNIDKSTARRVRNVVGRSPLALRLSVGLLEKEGANFDPATWSDLARASPELIQAALYDRVLRRIRDPQLRKIGQPGLLVRRLTEDIIIQILARPCGLDLSKASPRRLMSNARREGQLFTVDPSDPGALRHRQDVRTIMLPNLDATIPFVVAREINQRAIKYYATQGSNLLYRAEELYHRLRLGQSAQELDRRWTDEAGRTLRPILQEFSHEGRDYLRAKLGAASLEYEGIARISARSANVQSAQLREFRLVARKTFQSGGSSRVLANRLKQDGMDRLDGPLGDVYAEILVSQGRRDEFIDDARILLTSLPRTGGNEVAANVFSFAGAILEGRQLLSEAQTFWLQASRAAEHVEDKRVRLACLIGSIRSRRKLVTAPKLREQELREALSIVGALQSEIYDQRVLAREAAAELSEVLLQPDGDFKYAVHRLIGFVLGANEAFPSAVQNPARLREVGLNIVGPGKISSVRELNDIVGKLVYGRPETITQVIRGLRDEVDWSLAQPSRVVVSN